MSALATVPAIHEMGVSERHPIAFDTTNLLGSGESPSSATAALVDVGSGAPVAGGLSGSPVVSGNTITQTVVGSALTVNGGYRLSITFTAATGKIWTMSLEINCVV